MDEAFEPTFLVERPATQRFWVVRASGGRYVQHFRQAGLMAIGHLDEIPLNAGPVVETTAISFKKALQSVQKGRETSKASVTSHSNQAEAFCASIQVDDIVVTVDSNFLTVGRVMGDAFIDHEPVVVRGFNNSEDKMRQKLRRAVSWGPLIPRSNVPIAMEMTLFAHQTVFNIDRFWASIYHLLYPCFTFEGQLYLSANIQQSEELDNYAVTQLFGLLTGVELMGRLFAIDSEEWEHYPQNLPVLRDSLQLRLTSKAEFMSPGTIWAKLHLDKSSLVWAAMIYVMVFGGDLKFFKADGLIDIHTRQKLWDRVLLLRETHDFNKLKTSLKVDVPRIETKPLEVPEQTKRKARRTAAVVIDNDSTSNTPPPSAP